MSEAARTPGGGNRDQVPPIRSRGSGSATVRQARADNEDVEVLSAAGTHAYHELTPSPATAIGELGATGSLVSRRPRSHTVGLSKAILRETELTWRHGTRSPAAATCASSPIGR